MAVLTGKTSLQRSCTFSSGLLEAGTVSPGIALPRRGLIKREADRRVGEKLAKSMRCFARRKQKVLWEHVGGRSSQELGWGMPSEADTPEAGRKVRASYAKDGTSSTWNPTCAEALREAGRQNPLEKAVFHYGWNQGSKVRQRHEIRWAREESRPGT